MSAAASPAPIAAGRGAARPGRFAARALSSLVLVLALAALVAVAVAGLNGVRVRVEQTGSMAPTLQPGDLVFLAQTPAATVRPGDVIGVRSPSGAVIVHRVHRLEPHGSSLRVTTQGDANPTGETWTVPRAASVALVRGSLPEVGSVVDALKGPWIALIVLLAGVLLAAGLLRSVWRHPA